MNMDGKQIIFSLCERLKKDGRLCTDGNILILLSSLSSQEIRDLVSGTTYNPIKKSILYDGTENSVVEMLQLAEVELVISEDDRLLVHTFDKGLIRLRKGDRLVIENGKFTCE